jgi:hypothetical protein
MQECFFLNNLLQKQGNCKTNEEARTWETKHSAAIAKYQYMFLFSVLQKINMNFFSCYG